MAEVSTDIIAIVRKYLDAVKSRGIDIQQSFIYGSYANNSYNENSDIDLAIISDAFVGNLMIDVEKILGITRKIDTRLSVLPLNPSSLDSYFVQSEILNKGFKIIY